MSNKQQTAVEWLIQEIESKGDAWENASIKKIQISIDASEYAELKAQAKEMEKDKMENLWYAAISHGGCKCYYEIMTFEQYYNETFNQ
jgi:saccharopine dehydrogenase-like NADP-dependent oxidoreductase